MMKEGFAGIGKRRLHYLQWGSGPRLILSFHGYSNNAGIFSSLAQHIPSQYTLISFDLPFHGKSVWQGELPIRIDELIAMVNEVYDGRDEQIFLTGFSLGGRVALTILEQMPQQIAAVYLAAPDGLIPNHFYHFVTKNPVGRTLFRRMIANPSRHLKLINWVQRKGWIEAGRQQFAEYFLSNSSAREFLGNAWPAVQELVPSIPKVRENISRHKIPVHLFMGKWDKVIPPKNAASFAKDIPEIKVRIMDKGHRVLDDETARIIAKLLPV